MEKFLDKVAESILVVVSVALVLSVVGFMAYAVTQSWIAGVAVLVLIAVVWAEVRRDKNRQNKNIGSK